MFVLKPLFCNLRKYPFYNINGMENIHFIDHFARCKHWSRSTSCFRFLTLHKSWDKNTTNRTYKTESKS